MSRLSRTPSSKNDQLVLSANINSTLFTLPGGDVAFVLGYEHRREIYQL